MTKQFEVDERITVPWTRPLREATVVEVHEPSRSGAVLVTFRYTDADPDDELDSAYADVLTRPPSWWRRDITPDEQETIGSVLAGYLRLAESGDCGTLLEPARRAQIETLVARLAETVNPTTLTAVGRSTDPEECDACIALDAVCPYHRGVVDGAAALAAQVASVLDGDLPQPPRRPQYIHLVNQAHPEDDGWYDTRTDPWTRMPDPAEGWTRLVLLDGGLLDMPPVDATPGTDPVVTLTDERFGALMRAAVDVAATGEVYTVGGQHVPRSDIIRKD